MPDVSAIAPQVPGWAAGVLVILVGVAWLMKNRSEGLKVRLERAQMELVTSETESSKKIEHLESKVEQMRVEFEKQFEELRNDYARRLDRVQRMLLSEQTENFRLQGLLAKNGIKFEPDH